MALSTHYIVSYYTINPMAGVSAKINREVKDEKGDTLRTTAFRAEWLEDVDLQDRANARGADATNGLSWHDADLVEAVKEWLATKRYEDPTNVEMIAPEPEPEPEPEP